MSAQPIKIGSVNPAVPLTEDLSIADLFKLSDRNATPGTFKVGLPESGFTDLRSSVPRLISWDKVQSTVTDSLHEALDASLLDTLVDGWKHYENLIQAAHESRHSPKTPVVCPLAEHVVNTTLRPFVEVIVGIKPVYRLDLEVTLATTIKGLLLGLKSGAIKSAGFAACSFSGVISHDGTDLITHRLIDVTLPGELHLRKPIVLVK